MGSLDLMGDRKGGIKTLNMIQKWSMASHGWQKEGVRAHLSLWH